MRFVVFVSAIIKLLAEFPATLPSFFMSIACPRIAEYPFPMN